MMGSSTKRSPEPWTEGEVKRLCNRARSLGLIDDAFETGTSHNLSYEEFKGLGDSAQKQYFDDMRKALRDWRSLKESCPRIDMMALQHYDKDNRLSLDEQKAADVLQKDLKQKWNLSKEPPVNSASGRARPEMSKKISWYDDELQWNSVKSQFELARNRQRCRRYIPDDKSLRQYGFFDHISSSLLWYRLTILTGEPKNVTTDNYKSSWDMKFYHMDGVSTFRL